MREYFLVLEGEQAGPFNRAQILQMHDRGNIRGTDLIWTEGMSDWTQLQRVLPHIRGGAPKPKARPQAQPAAANEPGAPREPAAVSPALATAHPALAAAQPGEAARQQQPQPSAQLPASRGDYFGPKKSSETEMCSLLSLLLSIASIFTCSSVALSIPAVLLGHVGLHRIEQGEGRFSGRGLAVTGLWIGYLVTLALPFFLSVLFIIIGGVALTEL